MVMQLFISLGEDYPNTIVGGGGGGGGGLTTASASGVTANASEGEGGTVARALGQCHFRRR
jgi:hypothetical protein